MRKSVRSVVLLVAFGLALTGHVVPKPTTLAPEANVSQVEAAVTRYFAGMPDHQYFINQNEFVTKVLAGEPMLVIDIRQPDAYAKGHIRGAVNLPFGPVLADSLDRLPHDGQVFVYCYSGQSAGQTVMLLNALGVPARSVTYGWNLGISRVDGVNTLVESQPSMLSPEKTYPTIPDVLNACRDYYKKLASIGGTVFAANMVGEADAKALVEARDSTTQFISLQTAEDFAKGHIEGAINVPWGQGMQASFVELPRDKKLVVYCGSGQRSGQLAAALRLLGFDAVSLRNGLGTPGNYPAGWANKGYALVQ